MIVPVIPQPQVAPQDDLVDLKVAIRLLSGHECERDGSQAQRMLLRLSESADPVVAADARRLVKAGASNKWFSEKSPRHYELERIAEASLARLARRPHALRTRLALVTGLAVLVAGLLAFLAMSGDPVGTDREFPIVAVLIFLVIVALLVTRIVAARQ